MNLSQKLRQLNKQQTAPFVEIFTIYQKLLQNYQQKEESHNQIQTELWELKNQMSNKELYQTQKQIINQQEQQLLKFQDKNDQLNWENKQIRKEQKNLEAKYIEEKEMKIQSINENEKLTAELLVKSDQIQKMDLTIESLEQQIETLRQDNYDLIGDKQKLQEESLKHKAQMNQLIEQQVNRLNNLNQMECDLQQKMKIIEQKEQNFNQRQQAFNERKDSLKKAATFQEPKTDHIQQSQGQYVDLEEYYIKDKNENIQNQTKLILEQSYIQKNLHKNEIYDIKSNLNGNLLASCGGDQFIKFMDPQQKQLKGQIHSKIPDRVFLSMDFNNYNDMLIAGTTDKQAILYNLSMNKIKCQLMGHNGQINSVTFIQNDKALSGSNDKQIKLWDVNKASCISNINTQSNVKSIIKFNNQSLIASGHQDGTLRIYSLKDQKQQYQSKNLFDYSLSCVTVSSNDFLIGSLSTEGSEIKIFDIRKMKLLCTLSHHDFFNNHEFAKITFGPQDRFIYAGNNDACVYQWDINQQKFSQKLKSIKTEGVIVSLHYQSILNNLYVGDTRGNLSIFS